MNPSSTQSKLTKFPAIKDTVDQFTDLRHFEYQTAELVEYDIINSFDSDREKVKKLIETLDFENALENKSIASFVASAVGDALGAHLEGQPVDYTRKIIEDYDSLDNIKHNMARPPYGLYTDDTSQALCLADSLLLNDYKFNGIDIRHRIMMWWFKGYNNGRANDPKDKLSFGLGNTTMLSFMTFAKRPSEFAPLTMEHWKQNNANGSVMRIAPIPIAFHDNLQEGLNFAELQSRTTHNGVEASELCKLLTFLIIKFLNTTSTKECFELLDDLGDEYRSEVDSVQAMVRSQQEEDFEPYEDNQFNKDLKDRNWDWKSKDFRYSPYRVEKNKEFVGIYSMDAVAMSLHIVYHTKSLKEAVLRAVNLGGDCDSVGSITGALAGAIYGCGEFVQKGYEWLNPWDKGKIALRAFKLQKKEKIMEQVEEKKPEKKQPVMFDV